MTKIINIPTFIDNRGSLSVIEKNDKFPFDVKRVFYLFNIKNGKKRGGHAHIKCHQFLIAISGSFKVKIIDKKKEKVFLLNSKKEGLHIPPLVWAEEFDFSDNAVCLVLTSDKYDYNDYLNNLNDYEKFLKNNENIH